MNQAARIHGVSIGSLVASGGLFASGCATLSAEEWLAQPSHPPLPAIHLEVAEAELSSLCGGQPAMRTYGCAVRDFAAKVCIVYTRPDPAGWLMAHELKHCAGWDHGSVAGS